jgi:hypothetical protein
LILRKDCSSSLLRSASEISMIRPFRESLAFSERLWIMQMFEKLLLLGRTKALGPIGESFANVSHLKD